jgi:hypothetical protein
MTRFARFFTLFLVVFSLKAQVSAQVLEAVGSRSLGMGGAFVAVADDATATWWNPAGLAAGPFLDLGGGRATDASWFAAATPPFGVSYYRIQVIPDPTAGSLAGRQDRAVGVPPPFTANQLGATFVHTIVDGVHAGVTARFIRAGASDADTESSGDLDIGVLAVVGPFRLGGVGRNLRATRFGDVRLSRQVRVGAAFDGERAGLAPVMVAVDADVAEYDTASGPRRVVAVGVEQWLWTRRLGLRGGARVNTAGSDDAAATAGASIALRAGLYVDGHAVIGGGADERGWGIAGRVSF